MFNELPSDESHVVEQVRGVKFFKYWVDLKLCDIVMGPSSNVLYRPFVAYFADDLLASADAHAAYRFSIASGDSEEPRMLVCLDAYCRG